MPKVIYTPSKGLYQTSGSGFETNNATIAVNASTSLAPGGPVYVITVTAPVSAVTEYTGDVITLRSGDGSTDYTITLGDGTNGTINSEAAADENEVATLIGQTAAGLGSNEEFAYKVASNVVTIYSLKAGEASDDAAVTDGSENGLIAVSTTTKGVSGQISGRNNVAIDVVADSDVASLLDSGGSSLTPPAGGLTGITLANGTSIGQKIYVMNNSANRAVWVTGTYYDCTNNDSDTILKLEATEIQQLIWNGSAWAEGPLVSGSPAFA